MVTTAPPYLHWMVTMWASFAHKALEGDGLIIHMALLLTCMALFSYWTCASIFDKDGIVVHSLDQVVLAMVSSYLLVKQLLVLLVTFICM